VWHITDGTQEGLLQITEEEIVAEQNKFEVFKADIQFSRWVSVTTLGDDQMLFLSRQCSSQGCVRVRVRGVERPDLLLGR
jgi:hypothetical protein